MIYGVAFCQKTVSQNQNHFPHVPCFLLQQRKCCHLSPFPAMLSPVYANYTNLSKLMIYDAKMLHAAPYILSGQWFLHWKKAKSAPRVIQNSAILCICNSITVSRINAENFICIPALSWAACADAHGCMRERFDRSYTAANLFDMCSGVVLRHYRAVSPGYPFICGCCPWDHRAT